MRLTVLFAAGLLGCAVDVGLQGASPNDEATPTVEFDGRPNDQGREGLNCRPVLDPVTLDVIEWQCIGYSQPLPDPEIDMTDDDLLLTLPADSASKSSLKGGI